MGFVLYIIFNQLFGITEISLWCLLVLLVLGMLLGQPGRGSVLVWILLVRYLI